MAKANTTQAVEKRVEGIMDEIDTRTAKMLMKLDTGYCSTVNHGSAFISSPAVC